MVSLVEIFSSVQGEGIYTGVRQIFIRFSGCNLKCLYCDTDYEPKPSFRVEARPGSREFKSYPNPAEPENVARIIEKLNINKAHSISLTGGEPLLSMEFIAQLGQLLKGRGVKFYLETNGTLATELNRVLAWIDIICMDIKLPGSAGCREMWDAHREFLAIGAKKEIFVKTVVSPATREQEIIRACKTIAAVDCGISLVIQPVSPLPEGLKAREFNRKLLKWQETALEHIKDVRIIPQTHKLLGQL